MASSTTETGGAPRQTAPASGEGLRLGRTDLACVHPRARGFYALPAWGILVIRTGEKTVIPPSSRPPPHLWSQTAPQLHPTVTAAGGRVSHPTRSYGASWRSAAMDDEEQSGQLGGG